VASSFGKSNTERWERGFTALSKFRTREGHCCPSRRHVEGGYELGQWVSVQRYRKDVLPNRTQTSLRRDWLCLGLARRTVGTKLCGALKVQTTEGTLLRADPSQGKRLETGMVGCDATPKLEGNVGRATGAAKQNRLCVECSVKGSRGKTRR